MFFSWKDSDHSTLLPAHQPCSGLCRRLCARSSSHFTNTLFTPTHTTSATMAARRRAGGDGVFALTLVSRWKENEWHLANGAALLSEFLAGVTAGRLLSPTRRASFRGMPFEKWCSLPTHDLQLVQKCPCSAHLSDFLLDSSAGGAGFKGHHEAGEMVDQVCMDHSDTFHFTWLRFSFL